MGHFYSEPELVFIKALWLSGKSAAKIANLANAEFGSLRSRNSILGLAHRKEWPDHAGGAAWAVEGQEKRMATMKAKGIAAGRKPKPPATVAPGASEEEPKPLGVDTGCKFLHGDDPKTWVWCGHDKLSGSPYCKYHHVKCRPVQHTNQPKRGPTFTNADRQFR